jgi:nitroreductase
MMQCVIKPRQPHQAVSCCRPDLTAHRTTLDNSAMDALDAILSRRTVPQVKMGPPGPAPEELTRLLEAGAAAPDHGKLRPWRFLVVRGEARARLGELFAAAALEENPEASPAELEKQRTGPTRAPLLIVVTASLNRSQSKIPEIEQVTAAAAAAQNILLAAHAMGYAAKWSTGRNAYSASIKSGLGLQAGDYIVGVLYIGSYAAQQEPSPRPDISQVTIEWTQPVSS